MVLQVRCEWAGPQVRGGGLTLLHFNNAGQDDAQAVTDAAEDFWTGILARVNAGNSVQLGSQVAEFEATTGNLIGVYAVTPPSAQPGQQATAALPPASQGLLRLVTGDIRNNRIIRGRIFIPGMLEADNDSDGTTSASCKTTINAAALSLVNDATASWAVWSRPVAGSGGVSTPVLQATLGDEWAVLRSRRD